MNNIIELLKEISREIRNLKEVDITLDSGGLGIPFYEDYLIKEDVMAVADLVDEMVNAIQQPSKFYESIAKDKKDLTLLKNQLAKKKFFKGDLKNQCHKLELSIARKERISMFL